MIVVANGSDCDRKKTISRISPVPERRVKIPLPTGGTIDGSEVPVEESTERWSELTLEDGTVMRIKTVVLSATRIDNAYDLEGNPQYAIKSNAVVALVSVPDHLKRKVN